MSIRRLLALLLDIIIIGIITTFISFIINFLISYFTKIDYNIVYAHTMFPFKVTLLNYTFKIGMPFIINKFISIVLLSLYAKKNRGMTLGDKILRIRVYSIKYSGVNFYLMRFLLRDFFFFRIFRIINLVYMLVKKRIDVMWYDKFLGICVVNPDEHINEN